MAILLHLVTSALHMVFGMVAVNTLGYCLEICEFKSWHWQTATAGLLIKALKLHMLSV